MTSVSKKVSHTDINIKIRILKALGVSKPFGLFKHFIMIKVLKNLKQPNAISADDIWKFLYERYGGDSIDEKYNEPYDLRKYSYDEIL